MSTEQEYEDILLYKTASGNSSRYTTVNQKRSIREKVSCYIVEHNLLHVVEKQKDLGEWKRRVIYKENDKNSILSVASVECTLQTMQGICIRDTHNIYNI